MNEISSSDVEERISSLLDDREFQEIEGRFRRFNLFEAMGAVRAELRHSNFLAFILSPTRSHGLGSDILAQVLRLLISKLPRERRHVRALQLVLADLESSLVERERDSIDILIEVKALNLVVVIENKVDSGVGDGQLNRYKTLVRQKFPTHHHVFALLTPEGIDPDDSDYIAISYDELAGLMERYVAERHGSLPNEIALIINHYGEMLRRHIVQDTGLIELARKLYERHKEAFDFIIENRPQRESLLEPVRRFLELENSLIADRHGPMMLRFVPSKWRQVTQLNSCPPDQWTKTGRNLLFEIKADRSSDRISIGLVLGPAESVFRAHVYSSASENPKLFGGLVKPMGQKWSTIFTRDLLAARAAMDLEREEKVAVIDSAWKDFLQRDLPALIAGIEEIVASYNVSPPNLVKPAP